MRQMYDKDIERDGVADGDAVGDADGYGNANGKNRRVMDQSNTRQQVNVHDVELVMEFIVANLLQSVEVSALCRVNTQPTGLSQFGAELTALITQKAENNKCSCIFLHFIRVYQ